MRPLILIVEDNTTIAEAVTFYLEQANFRVITAAGQADAIERLEVAMPDLIILDVSLGDDLDAGYELCHTIRSGGSLARFAALPIVFLSARGGEHDIITGFGVGADDYIIKPFDSQELISRVNAVLRGSRQYNPATQEDAF